MTEFDDTLARLFAEAQETLRPDDFLETVAIRVSHARQRRTLWRTVFAVAAAGVALALTPYVAAGSLAAARHLGVWLPALGNALASPVALICSLTVAAWSLRRARRAS